MQDFVSAKTGARKEGNERETHKSLWNNSSCFHEEVLELYSHHVSPKKSPGHLLEPLNNQKSYTAKPKSRDFSPSVTFSETSLLLKTINI